MMVYMRKSCLALALQQGRGNSMLPAIFSVLRTSTDFSPVPQGQNVPVNVYVNPYLCPIFGVRAYGA
jgi:hypothetical protein